MSSSEYSFIFSSLGSKQPNNTRKVHIRRLYDILKLCIQRQDWARAKHAWAILARCREVDWKAMWSTSVLLLGEGGAQDELTQINEDRVRFLSIMMRQHPDERESILKELVLRLIHAGMHRRALEQLDLYLPSYPYQDNPVLHVYAGLVTLYLAQPENDVSSETNYSWDLNLVRDAQAHFERARIVDPSNVVAEAFLSQVKSAHEGAHMLTWAFR
ncbi:hypothetical protein DICSQDRAFT_150351 [Dichomitus squalens LYAD-421 SS1]|uniref:Uncharacterized protein n=1 Tax=Dichomitus squalens (strain LYAD-421) TaxID=732165 RepID=R7SNP9_DICSQ|nr:uncharacterized protein DICSQDRAFT_150351 [Dichomitus squalens LYAD-421 SS1]EJF56607.1 hypothetical protein DICSQDRAFT_150351 [Dichomitus squalens LYAD-421 SS1]